MKIIFPGDGYGLNNVDSFASGNLYTSAASSGSMMNTQNLNSVNFPAISQTNSLISSHSSLHGMQQAVHLKSQSINQLEKMNFQSSFTSREGVLDPQQQYLQHSKQFQQQEQYAQQQFEQSEQYAQKQYQLKLQSQQPQHLVNSDAFRQSHISPKIEGQVKSEPGVDHHKEVFSSQISEQFNISEMQNKLHQNTTGTCSGDAQHLSFSNGQNNLSATATQHSHQMLHPHQLVSEPENNFSSLSVGAQSKSAIMNNWNSQSQGGNHMPGNMSHEQHLHMDFHQRISRQDEAQCNNLSSDGNVIGQAVGSRVSEPLDPNVTVNKAHRNQQRWLLFLIHARRCTAPEGQCQERFCPFAQKLCKHIDGCTLSHCTYPRCHHTRLLLLHFRNCKDPGCPVCVFVRNFRRTFQVKPQNWPDSDSALPIAVNGSCKPYNSVVQSPRLMPKPVPVIETSDDLQPCLKRMKIEQCSQSFSSENDNSSMSVLPNCESNVSNDAQNQDHVHSDVPVPVLVKSEFREVKAEGPVHFPPTSSCEVKINNVEEKWPGSKPATYDEPVNLARPENIKPEKETALDQPENLSQPSENLGGSKSGKPKVKGVSMTELFSPEQVREHITGLRRWVGQVSLFSDLTLVSYNFATVSLIIESIFSGNL